MIRAAVGVHSGPGESNTGYINDPTTEWNRLTTVIDAAIEQGIYVIVDIPITHISRLLRLRPFQKSCRNLR